MGDVGSLVQRVGGWPAGGEERPCSVMAEAGAPLGATSAFKATAAEVEGCARGLATGGF